MIRKTLLMNSDDDAHSSKIERGRKNEERFMALFSEPEKNPPWLDRVISASGIEDENLGIDYHVVAKDGASIPVNIKSSYRRKSKFLRERRKIPVCVIIMKDRLDDEPMRREILAIFEKWRAGAAR